MNRGKSFVLVAEPSWTDPMTSPAIAPSTTAPSFAYQPRSAAAAAPRALSRSLPEERPLGPRQRLRELRLPTRRNGCNDFPLTNAAGSRPIAAGAVDLVAQEGDAAGQVAHACSP